MKKLTLNAYEVCEINVDAMNNLLGGILCLAPLAIYVYTMAQTN